MLICLTLRLYVMCVRYEKDRKNAAAKSDKFTLLDNKIDAVNNSLLLELKELKRINAENS